jgi:hydroxymethylpyrimidine pyrophosphatase-like HAD family hydrolase
VPVTIPPYPNQPVYDNIPAPAPMPTFVPFYDYNGLTEEEKEVLRNLAEAFNKFVALTGKHPSDDSEFCKAIHDAQKMIALRVARRVNPEVWKQYPEENVDKV